MATYRMNDGTVVKTENATTHWDEQRRFDGRNMISVATGSQWNHETLWRSRKGRFYVEHESNYENVASHAEWVSNHEATRWLLANEHALPDDLKTLEEEVSE